MMMMIKYVNMKSQKATKPVITMYKNQSDAFNDGVSTQHVLLRWK